MSLTAPNHRALAIMLTDVVPGFEVEGLAGWLERAQVQPHSNIGPSQTHWTVRARDGRPILSRAQWGMPTPASPGRPSRLVINARAETVGQRPMFRAAFARRRCLIPADGFFEWDRTRKPRQPWWFHRADGRPLLFAALVEPDQEPGPSRFVIVTVPAADGVERIHDRMPAIVDREAVGAWLFGTPEDARAVLDDAGATLETMPVSTAFNTAQYEGAIEPVELR